MLSFRLTSTTTSTITTVDMYTYSHFIWHHRDSNHSQKKKKKDNKHVRRSTKNLFLFNWRFVISKDFLKFTLYILHGIPVSKPTLSILPLPQYDYMIIWYLLLLYHDVDCLFIRSLYEHFISFVQSLFFMFCLMF